MKAGIVLSALLLASPANAQFAGSSSQEGGGAMMPSPDVSMCQNPPSLVNAFPHVWVVDPVNGHTVSGGGTGSAGNPWNSLQALFSSVAGYPGPLYSAAQSGVGPVAPGDEVLLMNGTAAQYGTVNVGNNGFQMVNTQWLTIAAAAGQTPILHTLNIKNAVFQNWVGITVQSAGSGGANPVLVGVQNQGVGWFTHDIQFNGMQLSSADDATVAGWTQAQMISNKSQGFFLGGVNQGGTYCMRVTNSHVKWAMNELAFFSDNSIIDNNEFESFFIDDVDFDGNNQIFYRNYLHDAVNLADGSHQDAMQAFITFPTVHDILIDSNTIIFQTKHLPFETTTPATYNGGIDNTDNDYSRITVTNNIVVWPNHNIQFSSCHDCLIAGNTALPAVIQSTPTVQNGGDIGFTLPKAQFLRGTNTIVKNNYSGLLSVSEPTTVVKNNVMSTSSLSVGVNNGIYIGGTLTFFRGPGIFGDHNIVDTGGISSEIVTFNNGTSGTWAYDFHLLSTAPARGAGASTTPMPYVDIEGIARAASNDVGAHVFY